MRCSHHESAILTWNSPNILKQNSTGKFFKYFFSLYLEQLVKDLSRSSIENEERDVSGSTKTEKPSGSWSQISWRIIPPSE